jgi:diaminopimelate epimerase
MQVLLAFNPIYPTRSVGFAHESNPKFQTTSFTRHFRGQSLRYYLRHQGKRSSEKRFSVHVGRILESDISIIPEFLQCVNIGSFVGYKYPTKELRL